jgi:hypothetical protein
LKAALASSATGAGSFASRSLQAFVRTFRLFRPLDMIGLALPEFVNCFVAELNHAVTKKKSLS